jgi:glycosyltransferase involved in cell wall biosynthesis
VQHPLVSIVIPVYNGENYLCEAINSALAQTYDKCETIVVNDGSTDDTERICLRYGDRIRYIRKDNGGVASALNKGIQEMRGEYFSWLSHDDIYYPEKISVQIHALSDCDYSRTIAFCNYDVLDMNEQTKSSVNFETEFEIDKLENGVFPVLFGIATGCALLIHKMHFIRVGLFDEGLKTAQDVDMWFKIFRGQKTVFNREQLILIRQHSEQGSKTIETFVVEQNRISIKQFDSVSRCEILELFHNQYNYCYTMAKHFFMNQIMDAFKHAMRKLGGLDMPDDFRFAVFSLQNQVDALKSNGVTQLCIFGAGTYGRKLLFDMMLCNIPVSCFSDNDPQKWEVFICGIPCIAPKNIDVAHTLIIVAMREPKEVILQLNAIAASYVATVDNRKLILN